MILIKIISKSRLWIRSCRWNQNRTEIDDQIWIPNLNRRQRFDNPNCLGLAGIIYQQSCNNFNIFRWFSSAGRRVGTWHQQFNSAYKMRDGTVHPIAWVTIIRNNKEPKNTMVTKDWTVLMLWTQKISKQCTQTNFVHE